MRPACRRLHLTQATRAIQTAERNTRVPTKGVLVAAPLGLGVVAGVVVPVGLVSVGLVVAGSELLGWLVVVSGCAVVVSEG